jgi:hypothetical protein
MEQVWRILDRVDRLPVCDARKMDEILGYNEQGHFN